MSTREARCWTCEPEQELLTASSIQEAVDEWADQQEGPLPETVTAYGFAPMELPSEAWIAKTVLEHVLELLDEEHRDPEGDLTKPSEAMKRAALEFARVVRPTYYVWTCEQVTSETVRVADYVDLSALLAPQGGEREGRDNAD